MDRDAVVESFLKFLNTTKMALISIENNITNHNLLTESYAIRHEQKLVSQNTY